MQIKLYNISSSLNKDQQLDESSKHFINEIEKALNIPIKLSSLDSFYDADISIIYVQSGGSEGKFKSIQDQLKEPYILLTRSSDNSLPATLEILSYLNNQNKKTILLQGDANSIADRINKLIYKKNELLDNLGVIGRPSDWLIASDVDYNIAKRFGVNLMDISLDEVVNNFNLVDEKKVNIDDKFKFNRNELIKAFKVKEALNKIVEEHKLKGFTIRCFDLLSKLKTTSCLSLALFNEEGILGGCESDIPTLLTMYVIKKLFNKSSFQANPSIIDEKNNTVVFAHCTLPLDMVDKFSLDTHFESGIGVAIAGEMKKTAITIFKIGNNLKDYYVASGTIVCPMHESNLCRTQIRIKLPDVSYFITKPLGNHHVIVYGDYENEIKQYMNNLL